MQIARIEPVAVSLPMKKPVIMAGEEVRRAENVLVRVARRVREPAARMPGAEREEADLLACSHRLLHSNTAAGSDIPAGACQPYGQGVVSRTRLGRRLPHSRERASEPEE